MEKQENSKKPLEEPRKTKENTPLTVEELEARVAMSVPAQKKATMPSPYPPGADYGLVKRDNLKQQEKKGKDSMTVEELEARVAMSVPAQKKSGTPIPYTPGTRYGLLKRSNL